LLKWHQRGVSVVAVIGLVAGALAGFSITLGPAVAVAAIPAAAAAWKIADSPDGTIPNARIDSVSCSSADVCTAVGTGRDAAGINVTLAERWNGKVWTRQPTPNPALDTVPDVRPDLLAVSCPAANFCLAVGTYRLSLVLASFAEIWNGRSWTLRAISVPTGSKTGGLDGVSCVSAKFCAAVGSNAGAVTSGTQTLAATWKGKGWHFQPTPNPAGDAVNLSGVSCVTTKFCEAVGSSDSRPSAFAEQWNGASWKLQNAPAPGPGGAKSVSCVSVKFCEAVGFGVADVWHGLSWRAQALPNSDLNLAGVSCASASFCAAVGKAESGLSSAIRWNGTGWAAQSTPQPASALTVVLNAVWCASAKSCQAGGFSSAASLALTGTVLAQSWNGASWRLQPAVSPAGAVSNTLAAVSCVSASFCEAVGNRDDSVGNQVSLAERWTGSAWVLQTIPSDGALLGVSCVSATFCEAVGGGLDSAEQWNGTSWKVQSRSSVDVQTQSVSCVSASFCMAVDGFGHVTLWNGSAWSAASDVTGFSEVGSVSCASASGCEVVGEGPAGQNAAKWDGSSWTPQTTPGPVNAVLDAISCPAADACEAVGSLNGQSPTALAEKWNGSAWTLQHPPSPVPSVASSFDSVWCTAADSCTAVGQFKYTNENPVSGLAEVWNGKSWGLRSAPDPFDTGSFLDGVSCGASRSCVAVGQAFDVGEVESTLIETGD
jgi:hypothetical protein